MEDRAVRKVRSKETGSKHAPVDTQARAGNSVDLSLIHI